MKQQFMLTAQFLGVNLWAVKSASPLSRCGGPFLRLPQCLVVGLTMATAGLDCNELEQGSQLLRETFLKLENQQPLFLLVKPKQIPPSLAFLT